MRKQRHSKDDLWRPEGNKLRCCFCFQLFSIRTQDAYDAHKAEEVGHTAIDFFFFFCCYIIQILIMSAQCPLILQQQCLPATAHAFDLKSVTLPCAQTWIHALFKMYICKIYSLINSESTYIHIDLRVAVCICMYSKHKIQTFTQLILFNSNPYCPQSRS